MISFLGFIRHSRNFLSRRPYRWHILKLVLIRLYHHPPPRLLRKNPRRAAAVPRWCSERRGAPAEYGPAALPFYVDNSIRGARSIPHYNMFSCASAGTIKWYNIRRRAVGHNGAGCEKIVATRKSCVRRESHGEGKSRRNGRGRRKRGGERKKEKKNGRRKISAKKLVARMFRLAYPFTR